MQLLIGFAILAVITLLLHIADKRKETADDRRTRKLVERAKREFPHNALTESLGDLYKWLYDEIVLANIEGRPIERLRHDRDLIQAEVVRLWQEEIDRENAAVEAGSSFLVYQPGVFAAKYTKIKTSPRHSASALTGTSE